MSETIAFWREAIKDPDHPQNRVAWLLFSKSSNPAFMARKLADQQEQIVEWLYAILDSAELYLEASLGSGDAPINAVNLLGEWQVADAVPHLLGVLAKGDWRSVAHDRALVALRKMDSSVLDEVIVFGDSASDDLKQQIAGIVADIGKGDSRAYEWVEPLFDAQDDGWDIRTIAGYLLTIDPDRAIPFLESRITNRRKFSDQTREILQRYIKNTLETGKP